MSNNNPHNFGAQKKRQQQQQLVDVAATGAPLIFDRYARPIAEGSVVLFAAATGGLGPEFLVTSVAPDLHPQAPQGALKVTLQAVIVVGVRAGVAIPEFVTVRMPESLATGQLAEATEETESATPGDQNVPGDILDPDPEYDNDPPVGQMDEPDDPSLIPDDEPEKVN